MSLEKKSVLKEKKELWTSILKDLEKQASILLPCETETDLLTLLKKPPIEEEEIIKYIKENKNIPIKEIIAYTKEIINWLDEILILSHDEIDISLHKKISPFFKEAIDLEYYEEQIYILISRYFPKENLELKKLKCMILS